MCGDHVAAPIHLSWSRGRRGDGYGGVPTTGPWQDPVWQCVWWLGKNWWPVGAVGLVDRFGNSVPA